MLRSASLRALTAYALVRLQDLLLTSVQQFLVDVVTVRFNTFKPLIYIVSSGGFLIASSVPGVAIQLSPEEGGFFADRAMCMSKAVFDAMLMRCTCTWPHARFRMHGLRSFLRVCSKLHQRVPVLPDQGRRLGERHDSNDVAAGCRQRHRARVAGRQPGDP